MIHHLPGPVPHLLGGVDPWWRMMLFLCSLNWAVAVWEAVSWCRRLVRLLKGGQGG